MRLITLKKFSKLNAERIEIIDFLCELNSDINNYRNYLESYDPTKDINLIDKKMIDRIKKYNKNEKEFDFVELINLYKDK